VHLSGLMVTAGSSAQGYIDPNFPNPNGPNDVRIIIYGYTPIFSLAVFSAAFFAVSLIIHTVQVARYRTWYFVTIPIALVFEIVGYVNRSLSSHVDPYNLIFFVLNYFFIVTAPVFLSAGIYAVLSILLNRLNRVDGHSSSSDKRSRSSSSYSPLAPRLILAIFITSDALTTIMQIAGAALIGVEESKRQSPNTGNNILLAGLSLQVLSIGIFCIILGIILVRARAPIATDHRLRVFTRVLVVATLLVYLRTCFRLAETAQGVGGNLATHEVFFACLEFAPVAAAVLLFNVWHPGRCLRLPKVEQASGRPSQNDWHEGVY
jgi:hypothetical protein